MSTAPEDYFNKQGLSIPDLSGHKELSAQELAFINKYLGADYVDMASSGQSSQDIFEIIPTPLLSSVEDNPSLVEEDVNDKIESPQETPFYATKYASVLEDKSQGKNRIITRVSDSIELPESIQISNTPSTAVPNSTSDLDETVPIAKTENEFMGDLIDTHEDTQSESLNLENFKEVDEIQFVSFFMGKQEFVTPISLVQEVLHFSEFAKLPKQVPGVLGIINLRGRMTPLIDLKEIVGVTEGEKLKNNFIVICSCQGMQIGLLVERIHTLYRIEQKNIDWNVEQYFGPDSGCVDGVIKLNGLLLCVVSVDKVIQYILK